MNVLGAGATNIESITNSIESLLHTTYPAFPVINILSYCGTFITINEPKLTYYH